MSDMDRSLVMFDENYVFAGLEMASTPVHGGKPEIGKGIQGLTGGDWDGQNAGFKVFNPVSLGSTISKSATNPPRNVLFADWHVETVHSSGHHHCHTDSREKNAARSN